METVLASEVLLIILDDGRDPGALHAGDPLRDRVEPPLMESGTQHARVALEIHRVGVTAPADAPEAVYCGPEAQMERRFVRRGEPVHARRMDHACERRVPHESSPRQGREVLGRGRDLHDPGLLETGERHFPLHQFHSDIDMPPQWRGESYVAPGSCRFDRSLGPAAEPAVAIRDGDLPLEAGRKLAFDDQVHHHLVPGLIRWPVELEVGHGDGPRDADRKSPPPEAPAFSVPRNNLREVMSGKDCVL